MSVVIMLKHGGHIWAAADNFVTFNDNTDPLIEPKLFKRDNMLFGFVSMLEPINSIKHRFKIPKRGKLDAHKYIHGKFWIAMKHRLEKDGLLVGGEFSGHALIGYDNKIFLVDSGFQFCEMGNYAVIGIGDGEIRGILKREYNTIKSPDKYLRELLPLIYEGNISVGGKVIIEKL